jgi:L-rhamnose-H+ transport protein
MIPITPSPIAGAGLHSVGAALAANCYAPQKFIKRWSWETFWIVQAAFCWLIWPVIGAVATIPELTAVLNEAWQTCPKVLVYSFLFSMAYGVGGIAFNYSIKYIGFALTYAIAVGLSSILGTIVPPLVRGKLGEMLEKPGIEWVIAGVIAGAIGIAFCGTAGRFKERSISKQDNSTSDFSLLKGLLLSLLAGVLSAVYGFAIEITEPVMDIAEQYGAGQWKGNVAYLTANTGAFVTSAFYCLYLALKNRSYGEFRKLPEGNRHRSLPLNYVLAILCGTLWYGQFFFYNLGHVRMGDFKFISWGFHMITLVLFSNLTGMLFREWKGCNRRTLFTIITGLLVLVSSVLMLTYGSYIGSLK